ncbi:MAG: hypothetical protein QOK07_743 [Gemmatimonadaceae bacterium]|jgi:glycosyltransferase involved in cell wall biosynthesis|nr:hypothetical protein [Gemmatimonadaceae bacterium]
MRLLLLQDAAYFPSYGGGNKANRLLMTALAARGHECVVVCKAVTRGTLTRRPDEVELSARNIDHERDAQGCVRYRYQNVEVQTLDLSSGRFRAEIADTIGQTQCDWVLVSDDKTHVLLDAALSAAPGRVVMAVHTHMHLPFGPEGQRENAHQLASMRETSGIVAASEYIRSYLHRHADLPSTALHFPVYGTGPFPAPIRPQEGYVTLINPCLVKGLPIFLELAAAFPDVAFAAVPTWGAAPEVLDALKIAGNIRLLPPSDDIGKLLQQTRILLVPSLIPETFGYVAVDAMLRGIPVMASDLGGLPEGKLGVDYLLPVRPARHNGDSYEAPAQDLGPWHDTLHALLSDRDLYGRCSHDSREAATAFVGSIDVSAFEYYFDSLHSARARG